MMGRQRPWQSQTRATRPPQPGQAERLQAQEGGEFGHRFVIVLRVGGCDTL